VGITVGAGSLDEADALPERVDMESVRIDDAAKETRERQGSPTRGFLRRQRRQGTTLSP
jgi:hypothetical protein